MTPFAAALRRIAHDSRPDGDLLAAFLADRDEAAFAELVRRHGPMVYGVCRRLLPDPADAEDAFQAAFLVLARRAGRLTDRPALGPWLYTVAVYTARSLRRRNARRLARQTTLSADAADPRPGPESADLAADLDAALLSLPEKYRRPVVLCHLQGYTRQAAAEHLRVPEGTLSSLLSRGLAKLRHRLADRHPAAVFAAAAVPTVLASTTVRAAVAANLATAGVVTATVAKLAEGVLHMFWVKKATAATFALVAVFGMGVGIGVSVQQTPHATAAGTEEKPGATPEAKPGGTPVVAADETAAIEVELAGLRDQLAAVARVITAAKEGLKLTQEKLKLLPVTAGRNERIDVMTTLTRFEENTAQAEHRESELKAKIKELEAKLAKLRQPKPPFVVADLVSPTQMALKQRLEETKRNSLAAAEAVDAARLKLKKVEDAADKGITPRDEVATALDAYASAVRRLAALQKEAEAVAAQLHQEEARTAAVLPRKTPPPAPKPAADPLADLEAQMSAARVQAEQARAQVAAAQAQAEQATKKLVELQQRQKDIVRERELKKAMGAKAGELGVESAGYLMVVIGAKLDGHPYQVAEFGASGTAEGVILFDSTATLSKYIGRVAKDPTAPKAVHILADNDAPAERVKEVVVACQRSGFKSIALQAGDADMKKWVEERDARKAALEKRAAEVEKATLKLRYEERRRLEAKEAEALRLWDKAQEELDRAVKDKLDPKPKPTPEKPAPPRP